MTQRSDGRGCSASAAAKDAQETTAIWTSSPAGLTRPCRPPGSRSGDSTASGGVHLEAPRLSHLHPTCRCSRLPPATRSSQTVTPQTLASSRNLVVLFYPPAPSALGQAPILAAPDPQEPKNPHRRPPVSLFPLHSVARIVLKHRPDTFPSETL